MPLVKCMRKSVAHKRNKLKVRCEMEDAKPAHRKKRSNEDKGLQRTDARFIRPFGAFL